jgi:hypothetical protein
MVPVVLAFDGEAVVGLAIPCAVIDRAPERAGRDLVAAPERAGRDLVAAPERAGRDLVAAPERARGNCLPVVDAGDLLYAVHVTRSSLWENRFIDNQLHLSNRQWITLVAMSFEYLWDRF